MASFVFNLMKFEGVYEGKRRVKHLNWLLKYEGILRSVD